jgi:lysophospholipase
MSFSETKTEIFQADANTKLLVYEWLPTQDVKAVMIGIHGGMAHGGDWVTPALYFKEKGVATYAPDLRWHGTYPKYNEKGKVFFHINSYDEYVDDIHKLYFWVKERHPKTPIFIICHSNGALIALKYALTLAKKTDIQGFIVSSPWLENMVKVPAIVKKIANLIAGIYPTFAVKTPALADVLTHDAKITARHHEDEKIGLRGTTASAKLSVESEKTQAWVIENMKAWENFPMFAVIAGDDQLANPQGSENALNSIPSNLLTLIVHKKNYHENFNEVNRDETFGAIWKWMQKIMA